MKEYSIWFPSDIEINGTVITKGTYPVISDNESHDRKPTTAKISYQGNEIYVLFEVHNFNLVVSKKSPYAIWSDFDEADFLRQRDDEEMLSDLEGLRPYTLTVEQYIHGDNLDWDGFESLRDAWESARLYDWSVYFVTNKQSQKILPF